LCCLRSPTPLVGGVHSNRAVDTVVLYMRTAANKYHTLLAQLKQEGRQQQQQQPQSLAQQAKAAVAGDWRDKLVAELELVLRQCGGIITNMTDQRLPYSLERYTQLVQQSQQSSSSAAPVPAPWTSLPGTPTGGTARSTASTSSTR